MEQPGPASVKATWVLRVLGVDVGSPQPGDAVLDEEAEQVSGELYRPVLVRQLKRLKAAGRAQFGMVLGRRAAEHRLLLAPNRPPRSLANGLARQTGLHVMTWGQVEPHPERPATLQLVLEGRMMPGLCKKGGRMLRAFRPLPFSHMVLRRDGVEVADIPDEDDEDTDEPGGTLPDPPRVASQQARTLQGAAQAHTAFCEECSQA